MYKALSIKQVNKVTINLDNINTHNVKNASGIVKGPWIELAVSAYLR